MDRALIGPPQLLIPGVPQVLLEYGLVWGPLGTFSPDCLEILPLGPTPWRAVSSPVWSFADWTWSQGQLRYLRAILLEMPLFSTVITSPSLFTWVPLDIFPQAVSEQI